MPTSITAPATGTANGFATNDTTETRPNKISDTGNVPSCAATVAASTVGNRKLREMGCDNHARPAVAPVERAKPTLKASIGSRSNSPVTDAASTWRPFAARPL